MAQFKNHCAFYEFIHCAEQLTNLTSLQNEWNMYTAPIREVMNCNGVPMSRIHFNCVVGKVSIISTVYEQLPYLDSGM